MRKFALHIVLLIFIMTITGCSDIEIFEDKDAKNSVKQVTKGELENGEYYVKEGTKFTKIHELGMSNNNSELNKQKCAWFNNDEMMLPDYYKNELIALADTKIDTSKNLTLERFSDTGSSFGIRGAVYENGYISFSTKENLIKGSHAEKQLTNDVSPNILIETIDGSPVTKDMLNEAGVFTGLNKDQQYAVTFYAGTYYGTTTLTADTHFLQSYEIYNVNEYEITKNGYVALYLPEDLESGYYRLAGKGFFRYYDFNKGEMDIATINMNEPFYHSDEEQIAAYSQQFTFNLAAETSNMTVHATFNKDTVLNESGLITMMLTAPDGTKIVEKTDKENGEILCDMMKSMPGKWTVNIMPQDMIVTNIAIESNESEELATNETQTLHFENDMIGVIIRLKYSGEGLITAQIIDQDDKSYDMVVNNDNKNELDYQFAYLPAGDYKVNIYHHPDTKIESIDYVLNEDVRDVEVITIEE